MIVIQLLLRFTLWYNIASMKLASDLTHPTAAVAPQPPQVAPMSLDDVLDSKSSGVAKHLGEIADSMCEWEGSVAENLELTQADVANIKTEFPKKMNLQALVTMPQHITFNNIFSN